jgi:uncharacterized protein (TIGR02118 family)
VLEWVLEIGGVEGRPAVLKLMVLLPRRADLSREAFDRYLRDTHAPLVATLPGLRRLVVNHVLPDPSGAEPAYDAIAEDWFDSPEALQAALASPEGQAVNADAPNLLDLARLQFLVVQEEEVALPGGQSSSTAG